MTNFLWDLYQHHQIQEARADARNAIEASNYRAETELQRLRDRIDTLTLTNLAMWSVLRDKLGLTDDELEKRVRELDLADGVADGKLTVGPWPCPKCKRPNSPKHINCLYCGFKRADSNPFPLR